MKWLKNKKLIKNLSAFGFSETLPIYIVAMTAIIVAITA